ncbi:hypothetical protein ACFYV7_30440 [Nocardia suismassiliense]|uniref:Tellurite resistance protein n=1 Tax=Nocardia suismassiliense TaxID=2077092 RepID=A0ABW6R0X8_9NOCA
MLTPLIDRLLPGGEPVTTKRIDLSALPPATFGPAMGIQGFALVTYLTSDALHGIAAAMSLFSLVLLLAVSMLHGTKYVRYPRHALQDLRTPALMSFYAQPAVTILLAAEVFHSSAPRVAAVLTLTGTGLAVLTAAGLTVARTRAPDTPVSPPQLIPWIAVLMVPITAHAYVDERLCWLTIGLAVGGMAHSHVISRSAESALPPQLAPTTTIGLAVPAVLCIDMVVLAPGNPLAAGILGGACYVLVRQLAGIDRLMSSPFGLSWWAFTMPFSALVLALAAVLRPDGPWWFIVYCGALANGLIVAWVSFRTVAGLLAGQLIPVKQELLLPRKSADAAA